ncbi:MAG TPA: MerR family transcriptional regulator [Bacteroidetes bacterium]|nr:MerR family transcriptional regulator [Bacteroidota bacterium]
MKRDLREWMAEHAPAKGTEPLEPVMTIGEAARITGLSESALRKYEAAGLILFHRSSGNVRVISREDLQRVRLIRTMIKKQGLNLEGIRRLWSLLPCWELKGCSAESQATCPVLLGTNQPCWVIHRAEGGCDGDLCRQCPVYRVAAGAINDMKSLLHEPVRRKTVPA